ncbi:MAG: NADH-quinone oxidoreductase subunit [Actinomycetota bacterium]
MHSFLAVVIPYWGQSLLRVLGGLVAVLLPAGTIVYVFLFKMMSFMQSRLGPMEAGPYGSMQLFAEVGKWLQKEDIQPDNADKRIFRMAPVIVLMSTFLLVAVCRLVQTHGSPISRPACFMRLQFHQFRFSES